MAAEYITRLLPLRETLRKKSVLLLGPRLTGKSSLLRHELTSARVYNLLDNDTFLKLSRQPSRLRQEATGRDQTVVIDEVQKLPSLLDEVQLMIDETGARFLLTGSSARKLKRRGANLLGGRARMMTLHPLVSDEIANIDLMKALQFGTLPAIYLSAQPQEDLADYLGTYLREEVAAEGLTRNVPAFSRFLEVAALCNGCQINFTKIANDAQVARTTVQEYFEILKDTLLAYELPSWRRSVKRKPILVHKFYFFDIGVARGLRGALALSEKSPEFGAALECFFYHELKAWADYHLGAMNQALHYWRSTSGFEVDFILADAIAIEVKAGRNIAIQDLKGLRALAEERRLKRLICASLEPRRRTIAGVEIWPWREFLRALWSGEFAA